MSDPVQPHRRQPTRLLHPWDFPGESTGVGCRCQTIIDQADRHTQKGNVEKTVDPQGASSSQFCTQEPFHPVNAELRETAQEKEDR